MSYEDVLGRWVKLALGHVHRRAVMLVVFSTWVLLLEASHSNELPFFILMISDTFLCN
jgi:hypothetical protein